ncbi:unnamed protein product [Calypogeia fissa]
MESLKHKKLDGTNYPMWSHKVGLILIKEKIWNVARDDVLGPDEDESSDIDDGDDDAGVVGRDLATILRHKKNKALYIFTATIKDTIMSRSIYAGE